MLSFLQFIIFSRKKKGEILSFGQQKGLLQKQQAFQKIYLAVMD